MRAFLPKYSLYLACCLLNAFETLSGTAATSCNIFPRNSSWLGEVDAWFARVDRLITFADLGRCIDSVRLKLRFNGRAIDLDGDYVLEKFQKCVLDSFTVGIMQPESCY